MVSCTVNTIDFYTNGSLGCINATTSDNISATANVTFSYASGETNAVTVYVLFVLTYPDGSSHSIYAYKGASQTFVGAGTFNISVTSADGLPTTTVAGKYTIENVTILNSTKSSTLCWLPGPVTCTIASSVPPPPSGSCTIASGYFKVNGSTTTCTASLSSTVNVECIADFSGVSNYYGNQYKAELKIQLPSGQAYSYYTPLQTVTSQNWTFTSPPFSTPIPLGNYSTVWFVIYDASGNTTCSSNGSGGTTCKTLTVVCTNPKFKCSGGTCISDQCDGSGTFTTNNCNNTCSATCTNPKYKCSNGICTSDNCDGSGTFTTNYCDNTCTAVGLSGCDPVKCPTSTNYCISGQCVPKLIIYGAAALLIFNMIQQR